MTKTATAPRPKAAPAAAPAYPYGRQYAGFIVLMAFAYAPVLLDPAQ